MMKQSIISDSSINGSPTRITTSESSPLAVKSPRSKMVIHPPSQISQKRSTLFQMMSEEQSLEPARTQFHSSISKFMEEFESLISTSTLVSGRGDVRVTIIGKERLKKVSIDVHKKVLLERSGFFKEKLKNGERDNTLMHSVEISECDDVEVYFEAMVLMYCDDLTARLTGVDVSKIIDLLKVFAAIMFENGVVSCLEYLEAVPWTDDEEEKIVTVLDHLQIKDKASKVLERVTFEKPPLKGVDELFVKLWSGVLRAKDAKSRKEMKNMICRMFSCRELQVSKDAAYSLCHGCLSSLVLALSMATSVSEGDRGALMSEIAREAENLQWVVEILIEFKFCEDFVGLWGDQKELALLHSKIPIIYRHEITKVTAQICIAIGTGKILVRRESRSLLLSTWLEPFYEDFDWMRRSCRLVDRKLVEDGLGQTILTLPLRQQQTLFLNWFDRFLRKGDDCPNIRNAFEVWWRRAFIKPSDHRPSFHVTLCKDTR